MTRRDQILANLNLDGLGLEVGPSHSPIVAGTPGVDCRILDFLTREQLIAKYGDELGLDVSKVQAVDYVWSGQRYIDLVGDTRFDWIVASHVIEHVPDLVGFIAECAEILKPGGVLSLAVPDKRGIFDQVRPPAGLGAVIDAHLQGRRHTSPGAFAEFELNFIEQDESGAPRFPYQPQRTREIMDLVIKGQFLDIHAWTFTPSHFRLLIEDLHALKLSPMRECAFGESNGWEFYVQLSPEGPGPGLDRMTLAQSAVGELAGDAPAMVHRLAGEKAALEAELAATRRTLSWRITAPLRALRRAGAPRDR